MPTRVAGSSLPLVRRRDPPAARLPAPGRVEAAQRLQGRPIERIGSGTGRAGERGEGGPGGDRAEVEAEGEAAGQVHEEDRGGAPAGPGGGQVDGDRGGAGAALDPAGGDDQAAVAGGGAGVAGDGDAGQLAGEVGDPVGPGEQAAGAGAEGGPDVGWAVVVADGDDRGAAVRRQVAERGAADQGDRRAGDQGGAQAGGTGVGHHDLPAGRGLDGVPQGVGGSRIVVGDDDQRGHRRNGFEGHGHPPGARGVWAQRAGWRCSARPGAGKNGRAAGPVEDAPARMCITPASARPGHVASRGCGQASFTDRPDE